VKTLMSDHPRRALVGLAAFVVTVGVLSWVLSGGVGRRVPPPATASSLDNTVPTPFFNVPVDGALQAVTCVGAADCWAVGSTGTGLALIEHHTSSGWSVVRSMTPEFGQLLGVTCVNAGDCWAVGDSLNNASAVASHTLVEHYAGSQWTAVATPDRSSGVNVMLSGVACVSATNCWAVGDTGDDNVTHQLIEHYTGGHWVLVDATDPPSAQYVLLYGVACDSAGVCWAVGSAGDASVSRPLIEESTRSGWVPVDASNLSSGPFVGLYAVTCLGRDCWAVGSGGIGNPLLLAHSTGTNWTPSAHSIGGASLGVACDTARDCWSVGDSKPPQVAEALPQITHFDGMTLTAALAPNSFALADGELSAVLAGVSCVSSVDCWAVGSASYGIAEGSLIEHYTGHGWSVVGRPSPLH
jgi:hypothetical protein